MGLVRTPIALNMPHHVQPGVFTVLLTGPKADIEAVQVDFALNPPVQHVGGHEYPITVQFVNASRSWFTGTRRVRLTLRSQVADTDEGMREAVTRVFYLGDWDI